MNSFKQLIGLTFDSVSKIKIKEGGKLYSINDSFILDTNNHISRFQIFTNQSGVFLYNLNDVDIHIDSEYDIEEVLIEEFEAAEPFRIRSIDSFWDVNQLYIIGFVIKSLNVNYHFIRLSDEITIVNKETFDYSTLNMKPIVVIEK